MGQSGDNGTQRYKDRDAAAKLAPVGKLPLQKEKEEKKRTGAQGLEPQLTGPESVVLPLHHAPSAGANQHPLQ